MIEDKLHVWADIYNAIVLKDDILLDSVVHRKEEYRDILNRTQYAQYAPNSLLFTLLAYNQVDYVKKLLSVIDFKVLNADNNTILMSSMFMDDKSIQASFFEYIKENNIPYDEYKGGRSVVVSNGISEIEVDGLLSTILFRDVEEDYDALYSIKNDFSLDEITNIFYAYCKYAPLKVALTFAEKIRVKSDKITDLPNNLLQCWAMLDNDVLKRFVDYKWNRLLNFNKEDMLLVLSKLERVLLEESPTVNILENKKVLKGVNGGL